jgi:uncharacterized coiled-coil DUF342 family protein
MTDDDLHAEIRHLRAALRRAEEDRDAVEQRLAYANQQITALRAKVSGTMTQAAVPR